LVVFITHTGNGTASYSMDAADSSTLGYGNSAGQDFYAQSATGFNAAQATTLNADPSDTVRNRATAGARTSGYALFMAIGLFGFACWRKVRGGKLQEVWARSRSLRADARWSGDETPVILVIHHPRDSTADPLEAGKVQRLENCGIVVA
jgi:hypothetical protein